MNNPLLKFGSWLLGCIFTGLGLMLVLKFGYILFWKHGDTVQPFWVHIDMTISWGCFPLLLGILLLMRKYHHLKTIMPFTCGGGVVIFGLAAIIHLLYPAFISRQLGILAISGLSFAFLSGLVWVLTIFNMRSRKKRSRY
jgi:hypothetical protein